MPMPVLTMAEIRANILRDIQSADPERDVGPDSDAFIRATSVASAAEGLYQYQAWAARQIFPDQADLEFLIQHARQRGVSRKSAVPAAGQLAVSGAAGMTAAAGQQIKIGDVIYLTTATVTLDSEGEGVVYATALVAGIVGNVAPATAGNFMSAPSGFAGQVSVVSMVGGTDIESPAQLLDRYLELLRRPPAGGNRYDYRRWALEVPGITAAYVYPLLLGIGTVGIAVTSGGGLPSPEVIDAAQDHIDDVRPVTAKLSLVMSPTIVTYGLEVAVKLDGMTLGDATARINEELAAYDLQVEPGATVVRSHLETIISNIDGITDRALTLPAANVVPGIGPGGIEWCRLGDVVVSLMP